jgi:hypothetical protein
MFVRIFIGESDRWRHQPQYEALVLKACEMDLAGATVLPRPMGCRSDFRWPRISLLSFRLGG